MSKNGEIYTAGKNFTLQFKAVTALTNFTSVLSLAICTRNLVVCKYGSLEVCRAGVDASIKTVDRLGQQTCVHTWVSLCVLPAVKEQWQPFAMDRSENSKSKYSKHLVWFQIFPVALNSKIISHNIWLITVICK